MLIVVSSKRSWPHSKAAQTTRWHKSQRKDFHQETYEALASITTATKADRIAVANLRQSNQTLSGKLASVDTDISVLKSAIQHFQAQLANLNFRPHKQYQQQDQQRGGGRRRGGN